MGVKAYDLSRGDTEEKQFNNLLATTADGNVKGMFYGAATIDVASLVDGAGATATVTVTGVALGDIVMGVSFGVDIVDLTITAAVTAANTVEVRIQNESTATVDLASTTVRVLVADLT